MNVSREKVVFKVASLLVGYLPINEVFATRLALMVVNECEKEAAKDGGGLDVSE